MSALPLPALVLLALVAVSGAVLLARHAPGNASRAWRGGMARGLATPAVLGTVVAATRFGEPFAAMAFAALSAWMLHGMLDLDAPRSLRDRLPRAACYACVPLQYGLWVAGLTDAFIVAVPVVATLALPIAAVLAGDVRGIGERLALRFFAVLLAVYALSYAVALGHDGVLTAFVSVAAVTGSATFDALCATARRRQDVRQLRQVDALVVLAVVAALAAGGGAAAAPLSSLDPPTAAAVAVAAATLGALATLVVTAMRHGRAGTPPRCGIPARLEAIAFAAPLVFFALR